VLVKLVALNKRATGFDNSAHVVRLVQQFTGEVNSSVARSRCAGFRQCARLGEDHVPHHRHDSIAVAAPIACPTSALCAIGFCVSGTKDCLLLLKSHSVAVRRLGASAQCSLVIGATFHCQSTERVQKNPTPTCKAAGSPINHLEAAPHSWCAETAPHARRRPRSCGQVHKGDPKTSLRCRRNFRLPSQ
jgi:hypothetical protein